jgi:L-aspartate oxidase
MTWQREADVVVVGTGAAGISAALTAAASGASVLVVTKDLLGGASPLAQGGLAAAIGPGDTASAHAADTISAGAGLCEPDVVSALAAGASGAVDWLVRLGARLERRQLRLEGGHSQHRIVHSGNDATGAEVHRVLLEALLTSRIEILDCVIAMDVIPRDVTRAGLGLMTASIGPGGVLDPGLISARAVILATGGLGQAFATTSNPAGATGDALAIAARAGAVLRDPEFVQFHPTVLWLDGGAVGAGWSGNQLPLITEALRGAGAVLRDLDGRPLMAGHDPRGDLAPRDIVAARIHEVISSGDGPGHVWLDATALGADVLEDGFPTVTAACRKYGTDPVTEYIPVAPGAHYSCGGILADLDGRTSIPGLCAVGEAASTGVQGANRLASNSLIEAVIAGRRAGEAVLAALASGAPEPDVFPRRPASFPRPGTEAPLQLARSDVSVAARPVLAAAMSRYAGVLRDADGLERLTAIIREAARRETPPGIAGDSHDGVAAGGRDGNGAGAPGLNLAAVEAANLREVSGLIAMAALHREESRGCHRRSDAPETAVSARHTLARRDGKQISVTWEEA